MPLPNNVHVSQHPCLRAKLSQLRSGTTSAKEVKALVHEIALIVGCEALGSAISTAPGPKVCVHDGLRQLERPLSLPHTAQLGLHGTEVGTTGGVSRTTETLKANMVFQDKTPLGFEYETTTVIPETISIVPILRSGLGMVEGRSPPSTTPPKRKRIPDGHTTYETDPPPAIQTLLPAPVPVHHLGLFREPTTLEPVEYYNNLPEHIASSSTSSSLALILDPVIATGGTCAAAIQTLREWGAERVVVLSVLGAEPGVHRAAEEWPAGVEIWLAAVDEQLTGEGMLKPGLGDVGDRLFLTIGK